VSLRVRVSNLTFSLSQRSLPNSGVTRTRQGLAPGIVDYALVLSARAMMLVNAATMESPVTTVSRTAANATAAIVPIAYSM
jgi:hypothetical protein